MVADRQKTQVQVSDDEDDVGVARLELQLPHTSDSVRRARRTIAAFLDPADVPVSVVEDVLLLVSELVTNAIVHAKSPAIVRLDTDVERIKVAVADRDADRAPAIADPEAQSLSGRGVLLVDRLASRWGVEPQSEGKIVWFELPRDA